ncbi:MAG: class I SAM-dependent methyltransferase [Caldilineaceae bacterium]
MVTIHRWLGSQKDKLAQALRAFAYRNGTPWGRRVVSEFWETQASTIHARSGKDQHDFHVLGRIFKSYKVHSILDVGCGSGRLFELYAQYNIQDVVGIDISEKALAIAQKRHPQVSTIQCQVEELDFPPQHFDLAICNRVLQHIPLRMIALAIQRLCTSCRMVYVNELTVSDQLHEEFFMFQHNYQELFAAQNFRLLEKGKLGQQTFQLYRMK